MTPKLHASWQALLQEEFSKPYFMALNHFLVQQTEAGKTIYPPTDRIFAALNFTPLDKVKVVILGQDPYHGAQQANGLSFSVNKGTAIPPSLKNIFKEMQADLGCPAPTHGDLSAWAAEGVLLLNAVLTVNAAAAASHQNKGWETLTDTLIKTLSHQKTNLVFMLWGNFAKGKKALINADKHLILEAAHPSPFSAYQGFMGCSHFSQANRYLATKGKGEINWALADG